MTNLGSMPDMQYLTIDGLRMAYREEGRGEPILFLHGNPTHSFLWRHVMPHLSPYGRCIAPDLAGTGHSDKPRMPYRFHDHYFYLEAFINKMGLEHITLVLHDWGSALGFHYARENPHNIKGMAFMEAFVGPWEWRQLPPLYRLGFRFLRMPLLGEIMIYGFNAFLNMVMPLLTQRRLTRAEKKSYKAPFRERRHRKPMLAWPRDIPIGGSPPETHRIFEHISQFLRETTLPKLLIYARPGAMVDEEVVKWCIQNMSNLETRYIGEGKHYIQEDHPHQTGKVLASWYSQKLL